MIIKGFWHCYLINSWYSIVIDQMRILLTSGLYDECEEIAIGCIGDDSEKLLFDKYITSQYGKLKIKYYGKDPSQYEFPTLQLIEDDPSDYVGFYFHTKGVTRPHETIITNWRNYLNEMVINRYQEHKDRVAGEYDVSSINFLKSPDHFSGNFYWFNRRYWDRLPKIDTLDKNNRWHAEQLICMGNPNFYSPPHVEPGDAVFPIKYK